MSKIKFYASKITLFSILAAVLAIAGCEVPQAPVANANVAAPTTTNANTVTNASNAAPVAERKTAKLPVTLPVLNAMFYDESFTEELKSKVGLSNEEIEKLKTAAGEAVAGLGEDDEQGDLRSTRAATSRAEQQIRQILGEEKATRLFETVNNRWASGDIEQDTASGAKQGAVPTDSRVVVNAPAYRMDVFQDGKLVKSYRVGIGYPEFPLPNGLRKAEKIIFNPTWTPPDEPWVKGKFKPYQKVEAGSKDNPLGVIKIPIGLPSLIHGGKQAARLGGFASHGCVGLTNAQVQDFSLLLAQVSGTKLTAEDAKNYQKEKDQTKEVDLAKTVPIELRYETIVVENGKLKIYRDVYEKGTNTEENLRRVLDGYGVSFDSLNEASRRQILEALTQMNTDATGQPITESTVAANANNANSNNANANTARSGDDKNGKKADKKDDSSKVTKNIKGKKEIEIVLAELGGKGYPAPVALNTGA